MFAEVPPRCVGRPAVTAPAPGWLRRGIRVWDAASGREGLVNGIGEPYLREDRPSCVWLLPPGGGHEWRTPIEAVRPLHNEPGPG